LVFDHVLTAYGDNGESAYDLRPDYQFPQHRNVELAGPADANEIDVDRIADDAVARILADPTFAAQVAEQLTATD